VMASRIGFLLPTDNAYQEHRLKVLFQVLDVNGDGGICVNDLTIGLKKLGVHQDRGRRHHSADFLQGGRCN
uniref:EF-hand domain-containing protein n=1 Tax=Labrus bergylta TaxID=56723 RepID=A0A3Q3MYF8_9LABR